MANYFFISYSVQDGAELCAMLSKALAAADPPVETWVDKQRLRPGEDWDEQIPQALKDCRGVLFIVSRDSVHPESGCKHEWSLALQYKKPIIPLRLHTDIEMPFRLRDRQYADFSGSFETALQKLHDHLLWLDTPEGVLNSLKNQLSDLKRELPRTAEERRPALEDAMRELQQRIEQQEVIVNDPIGTSRRTEARIEQGLERERQPVMQTQTANSKFINKPPATPPTWFQDRYVETNLLVDFLKDEALRLMIVLGRGGIGKTAMVCRLLQSLEAGTLPNDGGPLAVDGIVYLTAMGSHRVNFSSLFRDLCRLLPENTNRMLQTVYQDPQASTQEKMQALLENFQDKRVIVLLDNFEDTLETETGKIRDLEMEAALRAVLELPQHGVKIMITTRLAPASLQLVEAGRQTLLELDKGLDSPFAENILRAMDRDGKVGLRDADAKLLDLARERTRGYPRALEALFAILSADRDTSVEEILNQARGLLPENVVQVLVGEAFSRLDALAQKVMEALAVYGFSIPPTAVDYLLQPYEPGIDSAPVLKRLVNMQFIRREGGLYYLHPVDRAYALDRIPAGKKQDWQAAEQPVFTLYALRHRGAEYFQQVRRDPSTWVALDDLKPLFAEFDLLAASQDHEQALEVLYAMQLFLEKNGYHRQMTRMAEILSQEAAEPVRSQALALAGRGYASLGQDAKSVDLLEEALKMPDLDPMQANIWRLELARGLGNLQDYAGAETTYQTVIETSQEDVDSEVAAKLGKGWLALLRNDKQQALDLYRDALKTHLLAATMEAQEDGSFLFHPGLLPPEAPFDDPSAWYPLGEIEFGQGTEASTTSYLFGIHVDGTPGSEPEIEVPTGNEETDEMVPVVPVMVTGELARSWESLAELYERTDELIEAYACCRLAYALYDALKDDIGVASVLESMRRMALQFSDDESQALIEEQEIELANAKAANNRGRAMLLMQNLAQCYLESNRLADAEQMQLELLQDARELEFPKLGQQAELGLANIEWAREKYEEAVERLQQLLGQPGLDQQTYTDALAMLGRIEFAQGHYAVAAGYIQEASRSYGMLNSARQSLDMEQLLASAEIAVREYDRAVQRMEAAYQQAAKMAVPSVTAATLCALANAYLQAGIQEKALDAANQAFQIASQLKHSAPSAESLMSVAWISAELRKFDLSKDAYLQAEKAYESIGYLYGRLRVQQGLAWMYYLMGQPKGQIEAARQELALATEYGDPVITREARMSLATALSDNGLCEEAIEHCDAVLAEAPKDAGAWVNFGWILWQAGDYDRSLKASQQALEIDPNQTIAIRNLGHAYLAKGMPDEAEREYRRAIRERKGGEHFMETIRYIRQLSLTKPETPRVQEMLELFVEEQKRLDSLNAPQTS